jgi:competence protein ComEA
VAEQDRYRNAIVIGLIAIVAALTVIIVLEQRDGPQPLQITPGEPTVPGASGPIEVYLAGAVLHPGVYEMQDGDRVVDLLSEAGGHAPDANLEAVNLALKLHDEDQVLVPRQGQPAVTSNTSTQSDGLTGPVNLNTATVEELDALPGIGEVYSQRIIDSRAASGPYAAPEDLVARDVIPQGTYEKIAALITVGP